MIGRLGLLSLFLLPSLAGHALAPTHAHAQEEEEHHSRFTQPAYGTEWSYLPQYVPSSENFTLELRVGTYQPDVGPAFSTFNGDLGPMIGAELDIHAFRIPYFGALAFGGAFGWAEWTGPATAVSSSADVGQTGLSLITLTGLAALRIDGLAHYLNIPFIFTPKFGIDVGYWETGTASGTQASGWSVGLRWGAQVALELDFLDPRAAHRLDNAWGINHTEVFVEIYGSTMGDFANTMLPVGTPVTWAAGLGFTF